MPPTTMSAWTDKISNSAQVGGIETSVLDDGPARGTRIAWINTGTGLRYKVVIDRAMDIADAFYNQHSLAWLSRRGITAPQPFVARGTDWLRSFGGGLLTTCGLDHVGGPETDEFGERGLHGPISQIAAHTESIIQPDPAAGQLDMSITGTIRQTPIFGPSLELRRTISSRIGSPSIFLHDLVTNKGNRPAPHMIIYHFNFGWPLADEGARILWKGNWQPRFADRSLRIFQKDHDFRSCPPVLDAHGGTGEEVAFIDPTPDTSGRCTCGLYNDRIPLGLVMRYQKKQLPWLTNWQHWGRGEYVTGLEPGTDPPIGQARARKEQTLILLEPGESRTYDLEIEILDQPGTLGPFLAEMQDP